MPLSGFVLGFIHLIPDDMKNNIKLKYNDVLKKLLNKPRELATLVFIAFHQDDDNGWLKTANLELNQEALENLIMWGLVKTGEGCIGIANKKVIEITLKKKPQQAIKLDGKLLVQVKSNEVPEGHLDYFKAAVAFQQMFKANLHSLKINTKNVEQAKYGKWVGAIRLMVEADGVTMNDIREAWSFLNGHDFWAGNIQSTPKLREKFQTIHSQIKSDGSKKRTHKKGGDRTVSKEYVEQIIDQLQS